MFDHLTKGVFRDQVVQRVLAITLYVVLTPPFSFGETNITDEARSGLVIEKIFNNALALLDSSDPFDVLLGASIFAERGDDRAFQLIFDFAQSNDSLVSKAAVDTLVSIGNSKSIFFLQKLSESNEDLFNIVVLSLSSNPRDDGLFMLRKGLAASNDSTKIVAIRGLAIQGDYSSLGAIRGIAENKAYDDFLRVNALYAIAKLGEGISVVNLLVELESSGSEREKEMVAIAYGEIDSDETRERIIQLKESASRKISHAALVSGVIQGNNEFETQLIDLISSGKSLESAVLAAGLKRLPNAIASRITKKILACCKLSPEVSARLVESWAWIDADEIDMIVSWGLAQSNDDVKLQTLWLMGTKSDDRYVESVLGFLDHNNPVIRGMAAWAATQMLGLPMPADESA